MSIIIFAMLSIRLRQIGEKKFSRIKTSVANWNLNWQNIENILETHFNEPRNQIETVFSKDHAYWVELREVLNGLQKDMYLSVHL